LVTKKSPEYLHLSQPFSNSELIEKLKSKPLTISRTENPQLLPLSSTQVTLCLKTQDRREVQEAWVTAINQFNLGMSSGVIPYPPYTCREVTVYHTTGSLKKSIDTFIQLDSVYQEKNNFFSRNVLALQKIPTQQNMVAHTF
jgi:hypothetical protein